jgi:predicted anti-sigma-YlaC factor YlaD
VSMCEACSDRMPAVASGRSEWSAAEREHLAGCRHCAAEWKLVSATAALGRSVAVDPGVIAPRLLERVRAAEHQERRRRWLRRSAQVVGLAAAALVLIMVPRRGNGPVRQVPVTAASKAADLQLAELDGAAPAELQAVLAEFDEPEVPASALDGPDVEGLDVSQVERALRSWEES